MNRWITQKRAQLDELVNAAMDRSVRLAVTGLSQSGKTVFINALTHQILHGFHGAGAAHLDVLTQGRFKGSITLPTGPGDAPRFPYEDQIQQLTADQPLWPRATDGLSEVRLAIRYQPSGMFKRRLNKDAVLQLDLVDYPGEWLLDLPLLEQSFEQWSAQIHRLCLDEPRLTLAKAWLQMLGELDPHHSADTNTLAQLHHAYRDFLVRGKSREGGLSLLQPGGFLVPGKWRDAPWMLFCPLPAKFQGTALWQAMEAHYEAYKVHMVVGFQQEHFARFDRQIVLVDLLEALSRGPSRFSDMQQALLSILDTFQYGRSGPLGRMLNPSIDKLLFAATKVDQVAADQHENLARLIGKMVARPANEAAFLGVDIKTIALSSVVCTRTVMREHEGCQLAFVQGRLKDQARDVLLYPGAVPTSIPTADDWPGDRFQFMAFEPPRLGGVQGGVLPHMRLDQTLQFLVGDKFS
ncbi:YcjX family protein [Magnetococcus sp. PR-3]|uniref:YcjX family protein n=1 Tax=Magnetococcus sp. PR-3 TaxID=3120355 RepID=UPI002FCE4D1E